MLGSVLDILVLKSVEDWDCLCVIHINLDVVFISRKDYEDLSLRIPASGPGQHIDEEPLELKVGRLRIREEGSWIN